MIPLILLALFAYFIPFIFGLGLYLNIVDKKGFWEGAATAWGLGWGAVYLILFVSNQYLHVTFTPAFVFTIAVVMGSFALILLWNKRDLAKPSIGYIIGQRNKLLSPYFLLIIPLIILVFYKTSLALGGFDELVYHAYIPKLIYENGTIPTEVNSVWSNIYNSHPNLFVLQQSWVYFITDSSNDIYIRLLPWKYSVLTLGLVYAAASRMFSERAGNYAVIMFISSPLFVYLSYRMLSDMPLAFFTILSVYYLIRWQEQAGSIDSGPDQNRFLIMAGVFLGLASVVKYNGLALAIAVIMITCLKARKNTVWLILPFVAVASVFYMRNIIVYGNPTFPFFYKIFGGTEIKMFTIYSEFTKTGNSLITFIHVFLEPVIIITFVYLIYKWRDKIYQTLFSIFLLTFMLVFIIHTSSGSFIRYVALTFPLAAVMAGGAFEWLVHEMLPAILSKSRLKVKNLKKFSALAFVISLIVVLPSYNDAVKAKFDLYNEGEFKIPTDEGVLRNQGDYLVVAGWMDENLPEDSKVFSFEIRRYYIETEIISADSDTVFGTYNTNFSEALRILKALGVTHVFDAYIYRIHRTTRPLYEQSAVFQNIDHPAFKLIYRSGEDYLYEMDYELADGRIIDSSSPESDRDQWLDIKRYLEIENGSIGAITNGNTTMELTEPGTEIMISPKTGGAKRLWLDIIVARSEQFLDIKTSYISGSLTEADKKGKDGKIHVYAVGSERFFNSGPLTGLEPWTVNSNITFKVSDYEGEGYHIVFLRKVLV